MLWGDRVRNGTEKTRATEWSSRGREDASSRRNSTQQKSPVIADEAP